MNELHLDHKGRARAVLAPNIEYRQLGTQHEGQLLARQILDGLDSVLIRAIEEVIQQPPENVRMRRKDAPENKVILQIGERHAPSLPSLAPEASESKGDNEITQRMA